MEKPRRSRLYRGDPEECRLEYSEFLSAPCPRSSGDLHPSPCHPPSSKLPRATMLLSRRRISFSCSYLSPRADVIANASGMTRRGIQKVANTTSNPSNQPNDQ